MVLLIVNMTIIKISLRGTKDDLAMTSMLIPVPVSLLTLGRKKLTWYSIVDPFSPHIASPKTLLKACKAGYALNPKQKTVVMGCQRPPPNPKPLDPKPLKTLNPKPLNPKP